MNRQSLIDSSIQEVSDALGLSFVRKVLPKEHEYDLILRIQEIPAPHGFSVKVIDDYLAWRLDLAFDDFSAPMLALMENQFETRKSEMQSFIDLAQAKNDNVVFLIDGTPVLESASAPWKEVTLRVSNSYFSQETEFSSLTSALLDFLCLILLLLVEEVEWSEEEHEDWHEEGSLSHNVVRKYERSRYNRALCLKYYGFQCRGCGDLLEEKYGPIGFGVIHVHHIVPVSQMGSAYRLNPIKDLIPLCPNCHNIVHQKNPPIDLDELRSRTGYIEL